MRGAARFVAGAWQREAVVLNDAGLRMLFDGLRSRKGADGAPDAGETGDGPSACPGDSIARTGLVSAAATRPGTWSKPNNPSRAERRRDLLSVGRFGSEMS